MPSHPIELEIRGEIRAADIPHISKRLQNQGFKKISTTRRTSVMFFGSVSGYRMGDKRGKEEYVDIRCRITNGDAEVVTKIGKDVTNRIEIAKPVNLADLIAFSRMFAAMGFFAKVGSKFTENFQRGSLVVSLVKSPSGLAYIELEKMTNRQRERKDREELTRAAQEIGVHILKTRKQFIAFCDRLTREDDWMYRGTPSDVKRLKAEIRSMGSGR